MVNFLHFVYFALTPLSLISFNLYDCQLSVGFVHCCKACLFHLPKLENINAVALLEGL